MGRAINVKQTAVTGDFVSRLQHAYGVDLQRFLMRRLGRRELAEEVAQETWLQMHRVARPEEIVNPCGLLFDVAAKLACRQRRRAQLEAEAIETGAMGLEEVPDERSRPDKSVAEEQAMRLLMQVIERLPPKLKAVYVMRYFQQMPYEEIAERLGISLGAVKKRLPRAVAYCQSRLRALGVDWISLD